jgi:hypothetical protein
VRVHTPFRSKLFSYLLFFPFIFYDFLLLFLLIYISFSFTYHHYHHWRNSPIWIIPFLRRFCQIWVELDHPVFTSSDFAKIFFKEKFLSPASNPQPGGPHPCIYVPQRQGCPVIPPGTGFPFRHLLRLSGLRWNYCNPLPHGDLTYYNLLSCFCFFLYVSPPLSYSGQENRINGRGICCADQTTPSILKSWH